MATVLSPIYDRLKAASGYSPFTANTFGDWSLEAGDVVKISRNGEERKSPVYTSKFTWKGSSEVSIESGGKQKRESVTEMERNKYGRRGGGARNNKNLSERIEKGEGKISLIVEETDDGGNVIKAASIVTAINEDESSIALSADRIDIDGLVTKLAAKHIGVGSLHVEGKSEFLQSIYCEDHITAEEEIRSNTGFVVGRVGLKVSDITFSGNTMTVTYADGRDPQTFSKAATLSGTWSGNKLTVSANTGGTPYTAEVIAAVTGGGGYNFSAVAKVKDAAGGTNPQQRASETVYLREVVSGTNSKVEAYYKDSNNADQVVGNCDTSATYLAGQNISLDGTWSNNVVTVKPNRGSAEYPVQVQVGLPQVGTGQASMSVYAQSIDSKGGPSPVNRDSKYLYLYETVNGASSKVGIYSEQNGGGTELAVVPTNATYQAGVSAGGGAVTLSASWSNSGKYEVVTSTNKKKHTNISAAIEGNGGTNFSAVAKSSDDTTSTSGTPTTRASKTVYLKEVVDGANSVVNACPNSDGSGAVASIPISKTYYTGKNSVDIDDNEVWETTPGASVTATQNTVRVYTTGRTTVSGATAEKHKTIRLYTPTPTWSGNVCTVRVTVDDSQDSHTVICREITAQHNATAYNPECSSSGERYVPSQCTTLGTYSAASLPNKYIFFTVSCGTSTNKYKFVINP